MGTISTDSLTSIAANVAGVCFAMLPNASGAFISNAVAHAGCLHVTLLDASDACASAAPQLAIFLGVSALTASAGSPCVMLLHASVASIAVALPGFCIAMLPNASGTFASNAVTTAGTSARCSVQRQHPQRLRCASQLATQFGVSTLAASVGFLSVTLLPASDACASAAPQLAT